MIVVTRLNDSHFAINPDLIERITANPDTTLIMVDGAKYIVTETMSEVIERISRYRATVIALTHELSMSGHQQRALELVENDDDDNSVPPATEEDLMDPATIIGILVAFGALFAMLTLEGSHLSSILLPAPMVLVFGATIAVGIAGGTIKDLILSVKALPRAFTGKTQKPQVVIDRLVEIAEKARKEGLLSLEQEAETVDDPFLRGALQSIADGADGEDLRMSLEDEIATKTRSDRTASKFFLSLGGYAPTVGIIGTVVSLTHVLENLSTPGKLGPLIAAAFVATLWGLLSANFIWLPIGTRLRRLADLEGERMTLIMEGVLAVQEGSQPRLLAERLRAMVPAEQLGKPSSEKSAEKAKAA